jgi:regulator of cell morphogenesis and NO signaling
METVEAAARRSPRAPEILRGLGIDTCCGGRLTLAQAAASAGIPVETVLEALAAGAGHGT